MHGLTQIGVGGFKSLKKVGDLRLGPLNVLIGANGSGKSNLISLLRMLNAIAESRLQRFVSRNGYSNRLLHYGAKQTPFMWCSISFPNKTGNGRYYFELAAGVDDALIFKNEGT
jgi:predicted ATPase